MSTTNDHKAEAEMLYESEFGPVMNQIGFETGDAQHVLNMLGALTQATLYQAEQQRIANVLAYWQLHTPRSVEETGYIEVGQLHTDETNVDEMVRDALGII